MTMPRLGLWVQACAYLRRQWWWVSLNFLLLSLGTGLMIFTWLALHQTEQALTRDAQGIDLVVGAKGSPMQLILSGVYHLDVPTGNIRLSDAQTLLAHPLAASMIAQAIPLSLGDNFRGFRIVGTTPEYLHHYGAELRSGRLWNTRLEAVLGSNVALRTGLQPGQRFVGGHGLTEGGAQHDDAPYTVVGVLHPTGSVLDRLIIVNTESVWYVHEGDIVDAQERQILEVEREITLLLIRYRSALAAARLPRWINADSAMQAASPAAETTRLFELLRPALDALSAISMVLLVSGALAIFITAFRAAEERRYDLAMMRMMGAPPRDIVALLVCENALVAAAGTLAGGAFAHLGIAAWGWMLADRGGVMLSGFVFLPEEALLALAVICLACLAALFPAWRAARVDVATVLSQR